MCSLTFKQCFAKRSRAIKRVIADSKINNTVYIASSLETQRKSTEKKTLLIVVINLTCRGKHTIMLKANGVAILAIFRAAIGVCCCYLDYFFFFFFNSVCTSWKKDAKQTSAHGSNLDVLQKSICDSWCCCRLRIRNLQIGIQTTLLWALVRRDIAGAAESAPFVMVEFLIIYNIEQESATGAELHRPTKWVYRMIQHGDLHLERSKFVCKCDGDFWIFHWQSVVGLVEASESIKLAPI